MHEPELNPKWIAATMVGLALLACADQPASGQARDIEFLDISKILAGPIATREPPDSSAVVREAQRRYGPEGAPRSPDASLDRPIAQLALDATGLLDARVVPPGTQIEPGSPVIEFAMAEFFVRLAIVESKLDTDFDAVHYTLVALDSHDYARLTISRSGPEIVGSVFIGENEYRLLPKADGYQLVYPVKIYAGEFRRLDPPDLDTRAGLLEARHLQLAWKAERRPVRFVTRTDGRLQGYVSGAQGAGPPLGTIDIWRAMETNQDGRLHTDGAILAESISAFRTSIT